MSSRQDGIGGIVRRVRQGDRDARRALFTLLAGEKPPARVVRTIARRLMPRHHRARRLVESQDIVQSALHSAWDRIEDFHGDSEGTFYCWFRAILRTEVNRVARKERSMDPGGLEACSCPAPDPVSTLATEEMLEEMRTAIARLPAHQRVVIELRLRGATTARICRTLELQPAAVRQREKRAVDALKRLLRSRRSE